MLIANAICGMFFLERVSTDIFALEFSKHPKFGFCIGKMLEFSWNKILKLFQFAYGVNIFIQCVSIVCLVTTSQNVQI